MRILRIKLQFFAEESVEVSGASEETTVEETENVESVDKEQTENTEDVTSVETETTDATNEKSAKKERTFTQAELDNAISKRLAREKGAGDFIEKLAKRQNMTMEDFMKSVDDAINQEEIDKYSEEKMVTPEIAKEFLEMKHQLEDLTAYKKEIEKKESTKKDWEDFSNEYPDIKPEQIPQEVLEIASKGTKLVDAYARYENKKLKSEQENIKKQAIKDYLEGKMEYNPVEGAGSSAAVTTSSTPKTWEDARKQSFAFLNNQKEFKV